MNIVFAALIVGPFAVLCTLAGVAFAAYFTRSPGLDAALNGASARSSSDNTGATGAALDFELDSHFARLHAARVTQPKFGALAVATAANFVFVMLLVVTTQALALDSPIGLAFCLAAVVSSFLVLFQCAFVISGFIKAQNAALLGPANPIAGANNRGASAQGQ